MKRDRVVKASLAIALMSMTVIGGSIAFFRAETQADNRMTSTNLDITLMEGKTEGGLKRLNSDTVSLDDVAPGSSIDRELYVKNEKESVAYIRVTLTKYWEDNQGEKLPDMDSQQIFIDLPDRENWIIENDENDENVYMYYRLPLETGEQTTAFMNKILIGQDGSALNNDYTNLNAQIDVEVDAIQGYAAKDAILAEWGLDIEFDDNGIMVKDQVIE